MSQAATASRLIDTWIEALRPTTLRPGFMDNHAAEGCLHDNGLALWEMDAGAVHGGYQNGLRQIQLGASAYAPTVRTLNVPNAGVLTVATEQEVRNAAAEMFEAPHAAVAAGDFQGVYDVGTAILLQNMVFAPIAVRIAGETTWTTHGYDDVFAIVQLAQSRSLRLYGEIGFVNIATFAPNELELELTYPDLQYTGAANALVASAVFQGANPNAPIALSRVIDLVLPPQPYLWVLRPSLEYNATVLQLVEEAIRKAVSRFGRGTWSASASRRGTLEAEDRERQCQEAA